MIIEYEFHAKVLKVEERFTTVYNAKALGEARSESQMANAGEQKSLGWFVTLEQFGAAIHFGKLKPDIAAGDIMIAEFRKKPQEPPKLEVVPDPAPPAPIDAAAVREHFLASLPPEQRELVAKIIETEST